MDKLKRRQTMFSVFRTIAYFAGFPLLMFCVFVGTSQMMHFESFKNTWYIGLIIVAIAWFLAAVLQIVFGRFVKNQNLKTIVVTALVVLVTLGSAGAIDIYGNSLIKQTQEKASTGKYADAEITVEDYYYQANWFDGPANKPHLVDSFMENIDQFCHIYNLKYFSDNRSDENVDKSPVVKGTEKGLGLENVYISPNGLLGEGFLFGVEEAYTILIEYNELLNKAAENGIDLEADYDAIIAIVQNGPEYTKYKTTDEYLNAYGENGTAAAHMITEDDMDKIVPVVAKYLSLALWDVSHIMDNTSYQIVKNIIDINALGEVESLDELVDYINTSMTSVAEFVDDFTGAENNPLRTDSGVLTFTKQQIMGIVYDYTYYYSPVCRPVFDFIATTSNGMEGDAKALVFDYKNAEGEVVFSAAEVQRFAYARYYAKNHGANIGSVLVGESLGGVTLNTSGYPESFAYSLEELYQLETDYSYIPQLYPLLATRRFLYILSGICALSTIMFYQFLRREKDTINEIKAQKGGIL